MVEAASFLDADADENSVAPAGPLSPTDEEVEEERSILLVLKCLCMLFAGQKHPQSIFALGVNLELRAEREEACFCEPLALSFPSIEESRERAN